MKEKKIIKGIVMGFTVMALLGLSSLTFADNSMNAVTAKASVVRPAVAYNAAISKNIIGVDTFKGTVKKVEKSGKNIFLTIKGKSETRYYYIKSTSTVGKSVLKLKVKSSITVKYALGTPKKYGNHSSMPLISFTKSK